MSEYDPVAELGLVHDKQLVCSMTGFLLMNNSSRDLCRRFVGKGDKFYDMVSRYDDVVAYILNRSEGRSGNTARFIAPFLKAFGVTDYKAMEHCRQSLKLMPDVKRVMGHLMETLPTFFTTSSYEHNVMNVCAELKLPGELIDCTSVSFDDYDMSRQEARIVRDMASRVTNLSMPRREYELNVPVRIQQDEMDMVRTFDDIFGSKMNELGISDMMRQMKSVGANEKTYFLIDLRRKTQIDFDGTAFIGGDITDIHALDAVRDRGGLAMSFNGCDFAVRKSNVAIMSRDCTAAAILIQEFYNEGIEAVFDLVENWNRETLMKKDFPDPYLMSAMLESNPRKLPEVYIVGRDNVDDIAKKSDRYRKVLLG
ncbi:MAG: hypothetical protein LBJ20_04005 [Candidatus Methanoplasma sp.]|jgi:predicted HAD superfamily phosphohydrolase|nr:hypothetical protein [Candidatus Methanoplasma sp.]